MKNLVLPTIVLSHIFCEWKCPACNRSGQLIQVQYPQNRQEGVSVELTYPVRCACGRLDSFTIRLPYLVRGYMLIKFALLENYNRHRNQSVAMLPARSKLVLNIMSEFDQAIVHYVTQPMCSTPIAREEPDLIAQSPIKPAEVQRFNFSFTDEQWRDFLRRLGYGNDGYP